MPSIFVLFQYHFHVFFLLELGNFIENSKFCVVITRGENNSIKIKVLKSF